MNEAVKALLRRIAVQLRAALEGDEFALEDLRDALAEAAESPGDVEMALEAIHALTEPNREDLTDAHAASPRGHRVLSLEERSRLTTEAWGYLLGVRDKGTLDEEQFEWVLERALASGERRVDVDEIQDLVLAAALSAGPEADRGFDPGVH